MATAAYTEITPPKSVGNSHVSLVSWALTATNQDGVGLEMPAFADKSVQYMGVWTGAGTLKIQGSNLAAPTSTDWITLKDIQGTDMSFTADGLKSVAEVTRWIRPYFDGATAADSIVVTMMSRRL